MDHPFLLLFFSSFFRPDVELGRSTRGADGPPGEGSRGRAQFAHRHRPESARRRDRPRQNGSRVPRAQSTAYYYDPKETAPFNVPNRIGSIDVSTITYVDVVILGLNF